MAQRYTNQLAKDRMSEGRCPECGGKIDDHGGSGGPACSLTDNGAVARINQFRSDQFRRDES